MTTDLHLEQLEHVELQHGVLHLEGALQDRRRLEHDQHLKSYQNTFSVLCVCHLHIIN